MDTENSERGEVVISAQRRAIEKTYEDKCNIYVFADEKQGSITKKVKSIIHENVPCALSQKDLKPTAQTERQNEVNYNAKLFINPDIIINPGCEIEVLRFGRKYVFKHVGEPFVYPTHQELIGTVEKRA